MQKACAGLAGKPCYMDCWLKASSVPSRDKVLGVTSSMIITSATAGSDRDKVTPTRLVVVQAR
jgi:hypothetical protein